ncbi:hypothetical protein BC827DRAFT_1269552 [Russula dissimulans]|nr:hypothetical protein BC827DRAFT_1269552 [Russula dissimulans]
MSLIANTKTPSDDAADKMRGDPSMDSSAWTPRDLKERPPRKGVTAPTTRRASPSLGLPRSWIKHEVPGGEKAIGQEEQYLHAIVQRLEQG